MSAGVQREAALATLAGSTFDVNGVPEVQTARSSFDITRA